MAKWASEVYMAEETRVPSLLNVKSGGCERRVLTFKLWYEQITPTTILDHARQLYEETCPEHLRR